MQNKTTKTILRLLAFALLAFPGCNKTPDRSHYAYGADTPPTNLPGVEFVKVEASAFTFNETPTGRLIDGAYASFEVVEPAFWISREPVPVTSYEAYYGKDKYPRNGLSYDEANKFLDRIFLSTKLPVLLPSEAQFEAAINAGAILPQSKYRYLVSDGWRNNPDGATLRTSWREPDSGDLVVCRTRYEKSSVERYRSRNTHQVYLVMKTPENVQDSLVEFMQPWQKVKTTPSDGRTETIKAGNASFTMLPVKGGTMTLGATLEQEKYADEDEAPLREATVADFKLSSTEVTVAQWEAIMGELPVGNNRLYPKHPVVNVSWYDAQEFILRLRKLTGKPFRLPTEDEWEYAARGGVKSQGFIFAGGNNAADVAICTFRNKKGESVRPHPADVATKRANELGFYDMSGSVWEWVLGMHPDGNAIQKGGSRLSLNTACRVSNRQSMKPHIKKDTFGLRLAL